MTTRLCWLFFATAMLANATWGHAVYDFYPEVGLSYKLHKTPRSWFEAREICQSEHAQLAMPRTIEEAQAVVRLFNQYPSIKDSALPDQILVGFHDAYQEGEYVSLKGEPLQYFYHNWRKGQPDNHMDEDCGALDRKGQLNDVRCFAPAPFVCEKESRHRRRPNDNTNCPTSDVAYVYAHPSEKCYKLHTNPKKWAEARAICYAEGGFLAVIRNVHDEQFLAEMFNDPHNRVHKVRFPDHAWIGFHDLYKEGHYTTVSDEDLDEVGYVHWSEGSPNNGGTGLFGVPGNLIGENCGAMFKTGAIDDLPCSDAAVFICEMPSSSLDSRFDPSSAGDNSTAEAPPADKGAEEGKEDGEVEAIFS